MFLSFLLAAFVSAAPAGAAHKNLHPAPYFEPGPGSRDAGPEFVMRGQHALVSLGPDGVGFSAALGTPVKMRFVEANPSPQLEPLDPQPGRSNYFIGNDPKRWRTDVPHFGRIAYRGLYPGVDLVFYSVQQRLEYDFVVAPGVDPGIIAMRFDGAGGVSLRDGELLLQAGGSTIVHRRPLVYQVVSGVRRPISGEFRLAADGTAGFQIGVHDPDLPVVVDPELVFSTYFGGSGTEDATDIALDAAGNIYVTGSAYSTDYPTLNAFQPAHSFPSERNVFVTKLNAAGTTVLYSTYLGGASGRNMGYAIAVDGAGSAYVAGETYSLSFPVTDNAYQRRANPIVGEDGFLAKLSPQGNALVYSTYIAATGHEYIRDLAIDSGGHAYITGAFWPFAGYPPDFPTTPGAFRTATCTSNTHEAFLLKMNPSGTAPVFSTFLCGSGSDYARGIAVDSAGQAYVAGETTSNDFPVVQPLQSQPKGRGDVFVTKFAADGSRLIYSTLLGGDAGDIGYGIAIDAAGQAYVTGRTLSQNFPTKNAIQASNRMGSDEYNSGGDIFVTQLNAAGNSLVYSTYLGGTDADSARAIAVDAAGSAYVTGSTKSANFPRADSTRTFSGERDAFALRLTPAGTGLIYSTFLGGTGSENFLPDDWGAIAIDRHGSAWVAGTAWSADFPVAAPYQASLRGTGDLFVAKLSEPRPPHVSSASYHGVELAPESIASFFGSGLTATTEYAAGLPLPTTLAGARVLLRDAAGVEKEAALFFASPGQINYLLPSGLSPGVATVTVRTAGGGTLVETTRIASAAPGLFSANASGQGAAAGALLRIRTDGTRTGEPIARWDEATKAHVTVPIDCGPAGDDIIVTLYGTGIRGAGQDRVSAMVDGQPAELLYAGAQGEYAGLDQVNVRLSRSLAGRGEVPVVFSAAGKPSNVVQLRIR